MNISDARVVVITQQLIEKSRRDSFRGAYCRYRPNIMNTIRGTKTVYAPELIQAGAEFVRKTTSVGEGTQFITKNWEWLSTASDEELCEAAHSGVIPSFSGTDNIPGLSTVLRKIAPFSRVSMRGDEMIKQSTIHHVEQTVDNPFVTAVDITLHYGSLNELTPETTHFHSRFPDRTAREAIADLFTPGVTPIMDEGNNLIDLGVLLRSNATVRTKVEDSGETVVELHTYKARRLTQYLEGIKTACEEAGQPWSLRGQKTREQLFDHVAQVITIVYGVKSVHNTYVLLPDLPRRESVTINLNNRPPANMARVLEAYTAAQRAFAAASDYSLATTHSTPMQLLISTVALRTRSIGVDNIQINVDQPGITLQVTTETDLVIQASQNMPIAKIREALANGRRVYILITSVETLKIRGAWAPWATQLFTGYFLPLLIGKPYLVAVLGTDVEDDYSSFTASVLNEISYRKSSLPYSIFVLPDEYAERWASCLGIEQEEKVLRAQRHILTMDLDEEVGGQLHDFTNEVRREDEEANDENAAEIQLIFSGRGRKRPRSPSPDPNRSPSPEYRPHSPLGPPPGDDPAWL